MIVSYGFGPCGIYFYCFCYILKFDIEGGPNIMDLSRMVNESNV